PYTFWGGVIGGTFLTTASHGTDQLLAQRLLAARSERQSKAALLSSGIAVLVQFTLFLLVGVMLYVYYGTHGGRPAVASDRLFPTYIVEQMPQGVAGLLVAAIVAAAMSNLSAALNSLSSTSVIDFYLRRRPSTNDRSRLAVSHAMTLVWAAVLFSLAVLSRRGGRVVETGLSIASVAYGALLGVFLLGVLTRRAGERGAIVGMICGFAVELYVWLGTRIPWTWYVLIGTVTTFTIGYLASLVIPEPQRRAAHG
ncbi:MAG: sodium transporter, partial [Acidobacteriaceae bacterium]|nr:sodium transporter [Acidobacteriaceae bacterium]